MITPERWRQIEDVFQQAADLDTGARLAYLDQACAGDEALRAEVESLLESEGIGHVAPALEQVAQSVSGVGNLEGQRLGAYQILTSIGEGGMGTVYKAQRADGQFDQLVAIKIIRPGAASAMQSRRFVEERSLLAQLQHPFIARLIDGGDHSGIPYLVMELVEGMRIDDYCRQWNLGVPERLALFVQVCDAVQHAHAALIVHRDLKPSNIMVTNDGVPKLLDFGIATLVAEDRDATQTGWRMMTPDYASPEQVTGQQVTVASDVYSLGMVLYELLTGERPYKLKSYAPAEIEQAVCFTGIQPPSALVLKETKLRRQLKGDLDNILLMALRKEPGRRYGSVAQFAEDIRRHLAGETVIARPDTFTYRWSKFVRRNRISLALAASLILAILIGAGLTARQGLRAQRRFDEVRSLANSLLNEVDPEASRLIGAVNMRKLLVEKSLTYLDRLSSEAGSDISLQKELARAYHRVADIQGHGRIESLRLFNESLASHQKALAIEEPLFARLPQDKDLRRSLAMGYSRIGDLHSRRGDAKTAETFTRKAYQLADRSDPNTYIDVRTSMNRALMLEGRYDEALRMGQEALDAAQSLDNPVRLVVSAIYTAEVAQYKGDNALQKKFLDIGIRAAEAGLKRDGLTPDQELRYATLRNDRGEMMFSLGQPSDLRPCEAIVDLQYSADVMLRLLRDGGRTANILVSATSALHNLAEAQAVCGKKEAIETSEKASQIYGAGATRSNPNIDLNLGIVHLYVGSLDEARRHFEAVRKADPEGSEYLARIALREKDSALAIRLLAEARQRREKLIAQSSFTRNFEMYRQAANMALAIEAGDTTPGLRQRALEMLKIFPETNTAASIGKLRRQLR